MWQSCFATDLIPFFGVKFWIFFKKAGYAHNPKTCGKFSAKWSMLLAACSHRSRVALSPVLPGATSDPYPWPHRPFTPQPEPHCPPWPTVASYTSPCHRGHPARPTQPLPHSAKTASTLAHLVWWSADTLGQSRPPTCGLVHAGIFFLAPFYGDYWLQFWHQNVSPNFDTGDNLLPF